VTAPFPSENTVNDAPDDRRTHDTIGRFVEGFRQGLAAAPKKLMSYATTAAHHTAEYPISKHGARAAAQGGDLHGKLATVEDRPIVGFIDRLADGILEGWAVAPGNPQKPVHVRCYVNGRQSAVTLADSPRPDVEAAGHGTSACGFALNIRPALKALKFGSPVSIEVVAGHGSFSRLALWNSDWKAAFGVYGGYLPDKSKKMAALLLAAIAEADAEAPRDELEEFFADAGESVGTASAECSGSSFDKLMAPSTVPATLKAMAGGTNALPAGYVDYVRYRDRMDRKIQLGFASTERDELLKWYLWHYVRRRAWRRAPIAADDIKHLNAPGPIPPATRAMCYYLPKEIEEKAHDANAFRLEVAYWWAFEQAPMMMVEDCLVPPWCVDVLCQVRADWRGAGFPPSFFMERLFSQTTELHFLDLDVTSDRLLIYIYIIVKALRRPDLLRYIPREPLQRLLREHVSQSDGKSHELGDLIDETMGISKAVFSLDALRRAARLRMFDLDRLGFLTLSPSGGRVLSAALPSPAESERVDLQIIGPFRKASGLGQASRLSAEMIERGGFEPNAFDFGLDNPAPEGFSTPRRLGKLKHAKVNLIHLNAESIPLAFAYMPDVFRTSYNIGYFYWELDTPAYSHYLALELLDEIWVSSEFCRSIYAPATSKPVINVGMCAERLDGISREEARAYVVERLGLEADSFVFLSAFDSFSFIQRKNPISMIRAFRAAFPDDPRMRLVLKTHNRHFVGDPQQALMWRAIEEETQDDGRISVMNETLSYEDLRKLKAGSDCFVSLHRSEGWGFGMIEAMASGIPVVATAYSGNMDFCTPETCWLVDYDLTCLYPEDYIFVIPGQKWADPRLDSAVAQLRAVAYDAEDRERRVEAATRFVQANFSEEAIAARYAARLKELLR
jgi:glycosyltransferase involved in cell wall biosynthesis